MSIASTCANAHARPSDADQATDSTVGRSTARATKTSAQAAMAVASM